MNTLHSQPLTHVEQYTLALLLYYRLFLVFTIFVLNCYIRETCPFKMIKTSYLGYKLWSIQKGVTAALDITYYKAVKGLGPIEAIVAHYGVYVFWY